MAQEKVTGRSIATAYVSLAFSAKGMTAQLRKEIQSALKKADAEGELEKDLKAGGKKGGKHVERSLGNSTKRAGKTLARGIGRAMDRGLKTAAKGAKIGGGALAGGLLAGIGTALTKGFQRMSALENAKSQIEGLGYAGEEVSLISENALSAVKGTAYGIGDAMNAAALGLSAGVKEGADLEKYLKRIADVTAVSGSNFSEISGILSQVAASGKVTGNTLNELENRGFGASKALAEYFEVSQAEIREMVSAGEVGIEDFLKAMEAYEGAAYKSGETTQGALANMMASVGRLGEVMMGDSFEIIRIFANEMGTAIDGVADAIAPAMKQINEDIRTNLGGGLEGSGERFAKYLMDNQEAITTFLTEGYETFKKTVSDIFQALKNQDIDPSEALSSFLTTIQDFSAALAETVQTAVPILELIGEAGIMTIMLFIEQLTQLMILIMPLIQWISDMWESMSPEMQNIVGSIIAASIAFGWLVKLIAPILTGLWKTFKGILGLFKKGEDGTRKIGRAWRAVGGWIQKAGGFFKGIWSWIVRIGKTMGGWGSVIGRALLAPLALVSGVFLGISAAVAVIIGLTEGWGNSLKAVGDFWNWALEMIGLTFTWIGGLFKYIWDFVKNLFNNTNEWEEAGGAQGGSWNSSSVPRMATGGDVMGPTLLIAGEKDPETIVNRGLMNEHLSTITAQLKEEGGLRSPVREPTVVNVYPSAEMDEKTLADKVFRVLEWEGRWA